jgi:drug/metabolite transporter (DMT)-like permease
VALAAHFGTWIASLTYTGVASSVVLVSTNPIWVALASRRLPGRPASRDMAPAIALVMAGGVVVAWGDAGSGLATHALWGDLLALLGAVSMSAYILLGRAVRRKLSTIAYVWPCYGLAGLLLLALCLATGQPLHGYGQHTVLILFLLAVGPQIVGHSAFNWALAHFSPVLVTLAILGEPVGATLLAAAALGERPAPAALIGAAAILAGLYLGALAERRRVPSRNETLAAEPSHAQAMPAPGSHIDKERGP